MDRQEASTVDDRNMTPVPRVLFVLGPYALPHLVARPGHKASHGVHFHLWSVVRFRCEYSYGYFEVFKRALLLSYSAARFPTYGAAHFAVRCSIKPPLKFRSLLPFQPSKYSSPPSTPGTATDEILHPTFRQLLLSPIQHFRDAYFHR